MQIYRLLGRRAGLFVLFCLLALLPTLSVLADNSVTERTPFAVSLALDPTSQTVAVGDSFTIDVAASGLDDLGSFEFTLNYDPTVLQFDDASLNDTFLGSTGRNFIPTGPNDDNGTVTYGAFSLETNPGPSGSGVLATLTFIALTNGQSNMQFSSAQVTDISGTAQEIDQMTNAQVTVSSVSSTPTATATATATPSPSGSVSLAIEPANRNVHVNDTFTVDVAIGAVENLGGFEFTLTYDSNLIQFNEASLDDSFLASTGRTFSATGPTQGNGTVTYGAFSLGANLGPSGDGVIATLTFTALTNGQSPIEFTDAQVTDIIGSTQNIAQKTGGEVIVNEVSNLSLAIEPQNQNVHLNDTFTVDVEIGEVENLGGFEFTLSYDSNLIQFNEGSLNNSFLASTGRNFSPIGPSEGNGTVTYGAFSLGTDPGPSGDGVIATLTFTALAEGQSSIEFTTAQVTDVAGDTQSIGQKTHGQVTVNEGPTPTIIPTITPTPTIIPTITPTPTIIPTITPTPTIIPTITPTPSIIPSITPSITASITPSPAGPTPTLPPQDSINVDAFASQEDINVRWDLDGPLSGELQQYKLYRSDDGENNYTLIATLTNTQYRDNDSSLISGTTYCYKVEALDQNGNVIGISDSDCARFGSLAIWVPDQTVDANGTNIPVTINLANGNGLCVRALDIKLSYDQNIVQANGNVSPTIFTSGYAFEANTDTPGEVKISAVIGQGCQELYGAGRLFDVFFDVTGSSGTTSTLDFIEGLTATVIYDEDDLDNAVPLILQNGILTVNSTFVRGDLNGDGVVNSADAALALDFASGVRTPTEQQQGACDVNGDEACNSADASLILCYAAHQDWTRCGGSQSPTRANQNPDETVSVKITQLSQTAPEKLRVAVELTNASSFAGGDFDFTYDASKMTVNSVSLTSLTSGFEMQSNTQEAGILQVALASDDPIGSDGAILELEFNLNNGASSIDFASVTLNDMSGRDFTTSALQQQIEAPPFEPNESVDEDNKLYLPLVID